MKDFEEMKTREQLIIDQLESSNELNAALEAKLKKTEGVVKKHELTVKEYKQKIKTLTEKSKKQEQEISKMKNQAELDLNHLETKNRLLTEALNKRNEDVKALENGNEDLINLLEKCDDKIQKLDEDFKVERMKAEKYEQLFENDGKDDFKIDTESLDGRINFLVTTLEEYRRILEDDSDMNGPRDGDNPDHRE